MDEMRKVSGGGREGDGEKSVRSPVKHRIVPTRCLPNTFPAVFVCLFENRYRIIF